MLTRIITGVIGALVAVAIITVGGIYFSIAVTLLGLIGWWEFRNMTISKGYDIYLSSGVGSLGLLTIAGMGYYVEMESVYVMAFLTMVTAIFIILTTIEGLWRHCNRGDTHWASNTGFSAFAMLYCGLLMSHVTLLRSFDYGPHIDMGFRAFEYGELCLWTALIGTWASDTFAYFVGCAFGKTSFCSVSPKKSFEGGVGGFVGCFIIVLFLCIIGIGVPLWQACIIALSVAFFAPLGDLVESILKRSFEIKDSGKLFPGHGGVLDRFDSLLFTAPAVYYLLLVFSIF